MSGNVNLNVGANKAGQVGKLVPKQTLKTAVASGMVSMADSIFNAGKGVAHNDATYSHDGKYTYSGTASYTEDTVVDFEDGKPVGKYKIDGNAHWESTIHETGTVTDKEGDVPYEGDVKYSEDAHYEGTTGTDKKE